MYNGFTYPLPVTDGNREMVAEVELAAKKLFDKPIKTLPYSQFMLFAKTGSRVEYEESYMEHRKMLCAFCAMVLLDKGDEWLEKLCDIIWAICDEYTWALPAHIVRCKSAKETASCIDLFASETAFALSEIHCLLRDKLPQAVKDRIEYELDRRIISPYLEGNRRWGKNNWSAVCASGVGATLIYLGLDEKFTRAKDNILLNLGDFLESFPDDGCCLEGSLYWFYGFSHFCYIAQMLHEYTDGKINCFADEKVKKIASFCNNMYLADNFCIPFSDSPHTYNYNSGILRYIPIPLGISTAKTPIFLPPRQATTTNPTTTTTWEAFLFLTAENTFLTMRAGRYTTTNTLTRTKDTRAQAVPRRSDTVCRSLTDVRRNSERNTAEK